MTKSSSEVTLPRIVNSHSMVSQGKRKFGCPVSDVQTKKLIFNKANKMRKALAVTKSGGGRVKPLGYKYTVFTE